MSGVGALYTETVANLVDQNFDFGLKDYPIFNEEYRSHLNKKIVEHYMFYEIGHETESMFKFALNRKMREIMPYYNQMYASCLINFDPLSTSDFTDAFKSSEHGNTSGTNENNAHSDTTSLGDRSAHGVSDTVSNETRSESTTETGTQDATGDKSQIENTTSDSTRTRDGDKHSDGTSKGSENTSSDSDSSNTTTSSARNVQSDFPQQMLAANGDYATGATDAVSKATGSNSATAHASKNETGESHEDATEHEKEVGHETGSRKLTENTSSHENASKAGTLDGTRAGHDHGTTSEDAHESGSSSTVAGETGATAGEHSNELETVRRLTGYSGSAADLLQRYRETFVNVDMDVIYELRELFMGLWNNGDNYERYNRGYDTIYGGPLAFPRF